MKLLAGLAILGAAAFSSADFYTYTFGADVLSFDDEGSALNVIDSINLGAGAVVTGIGWDVDLEAFSPSWQSELTVSFADDANLPGLYLFPGGGVDTPGTGNFSSGGIIDLTDNSIPDITLSTGTLNMEFFEGFDDAVGVADGRWLAGSTLTLEYTPAPVPEPASMAVLGLGVAALARRRRAR
jgi:hypothetical protein